MRKQGGLPVFGGKLPARTVGCFFVGACSGPAWRARIRGRLFVFLIEAAEQVPPGGTDLGPAKPFPKSHQGTSVHWHLRLCLLAGMQLSACMQHDRKVRCKNQSGPTELKLNIPACQDWFLSFLPSGAPASSPRSWPRPSDPATWSDAYVVLLLRQRCSKELAQYIFLVHEHVVTMADIDALFQACSGGVQTVGSRSSWANAEFMLDVITTSTCCLGEEVKRNHRVLKWMPTGATHTCA